MPQEEFTDQTGIGTPAPLIPTGPTVQVSATNTGGSGGGGGSGQPNVDAITMAGSIGFSKAFFASDPELQALIDRAVREQWDATQFQANFMNTNWYRSREASVRQWIDLETRDPAEATAKINARMLDFANQLSQYGVKLDGTALREQARLSLIYNWSTAQTSKYLSSFIDFTPGKMAGTPAAIEMQLTRLAGDYGLKVQPSQLGSWVKGTLIGKYTEDNFRDMFRDMAKSKYLPIGAQLDQGMTVREIAQPYIQSYSELLEVNSDTVNLRDNLIQKALQGKPTQDGKPPVMQTVYEFERDLRRDPRWVRTKNARTSLVDATQGILRDWGLVG